jgi:hypothetical protein
MASKDSVDMSQRELAAIKSLSYKDSCSSKKRVFSQIKSLWLREESSRLRNSGTIRSRT